MQMLTIVVCVLALGATTATNAEKRTKKLIEYGWDVPDCAYVREHIREMEKLPFDGLIFHLPHWVDSANIFTRKKWNESDFEQAYEDCRNIEWKKFTDNFIIMLAASDMDWFSDDDWEAVRQHVGIIAKAAALARCRGVCFDAEPYGNNPWSYSTQARAKEKSFSEYEAKVRQRGAEFVRVIAQHMRKPVIHTFFQLSYLGHIMDEPDPAKRSQRLSQEGYGLLPAFLNGMLDAAGSQVTITDGNESAYYYTSPQQYDRARQMVKQRAVTLVAPENVATYRRQMQMSQALYVDYVFGLGIWGQRHSPAPAMTLEQRQRWFEHNVYHALRTADEFVWLYSEKMNWWKSVDLPPGLEEAVRSAKNKISRGEPLGFEVSDMIKSVREKRQKELKDQLITRTADIQRLPEGVSLPIIDGRLDDSFWQRVQPLEPLVPYVGVGTQAKVETRAWVTYDDQNLYIAVKCPEPKKSEMRVVGKNRDDSVWEGDSIDVFISQRATAVPYVHLILNANNVQWDALFKTKNLTTFNPRWRSGTWVGEDLWSAEICIAWKEMKMKPPAPGEKHRANICRQRIPDAEQTSWSQMFGGFLESENFGTWVFR